MNNSTSKRLTIVLATVCVVSFALTIVVIWSVGWLPIQAVFADEQTKIFEEMRSQALQSKGPADGAACLKSVISYYPSGSKQKVGSRLDRVVERHRNAVTREIVAHLRQTTGQDLGENAEAWVQKYAPN